MHEIELPFDYEQLDDTTRRYVEARTGEIRALVRRSAADIMEIGQKLSEVKERLPHGRFGRWLESEFGWGERMAQNFMRVAARFKTANFADLDIAPSALYLLASPSTPDAAVEAAMDQAGGGAPVTYGDARAIVESHRPSRFVCDACGEIFDAAVWHCPYCDSHWQPSQPTCLACGHDRASGHRADAVRELRRDAPELADAVRDGQLSIPQARRALRQRADERRETAAGADLALYCADALAVIPTLADGSVALVIADPPYGTTDHAWDFHGTEREYLGWLAGWLAALRPKLAAGYHFFLFCDPDYVARVEAVLTATGYPLKSRLVWEYRNLPSGRDVTDRFITNWQMVFHCGTRPLALPATWDDRRFAVQNHARPQSNFDEGSHHPTPKPVELLKIFVAFGSLPDELVLDPFAGGGSTGEACLAVGGRRGVLVEKEEAFCRAIEARLGVRARGV